jgi:hypothetical protein
MAILTVFNVPTMNGETYNRILRDLETAGAGRPKGRLYHVASLREDGSLMVTDVWESTELLDAFSQTLMPILNKAGVTAVEPTVYPVHNVIEG